MTILETIKSIILDFQEINFQKLQSGEFVAKMREWILYFLTALCAVMVAESCLYTIFQSLTIFLNTNVAAYGS
jgi:hypothetical protein